jgi:asparagine synthase (glutamine-hydrolysing)
MIYAGIFDFNGMPDSFDVISSIIASYTFPTTIRKDNLTLCYGKRSNRQDMDMVLKNASSILMGRVFYKARACVFEQEDFGNLSLVSKENILKKIWGKYVYVHIDKDQFNVVVDVTGQLPFFYYVFPNGNVLFSSDIEIIFKILRQKPEYNWTYLSCYLLYGDSSATVTPFKSIYELPPGCCLKITKNERKSEPFWNPLCSYEEPFSYKRREAVDVMQTTLKPLIEPYKHICVSLSGGLDSSSLVYCLSALKNKDQVLSAQNHFHANVKSSNELVHARKVCQETSIDLIEVDISHPLPFSPTSKKLLFKPNKPFSGLITLGVAERISDYIPSDGPCIFLSGHGSDHIFMRPPTRKSASDYLLERGFRGFKEKLEEITHFYRDSLSPILLDNIISLISYSVSRRLNKRYTKNLRDKTPKWIKQELINQSSSDFKHPIYACLPSRVLPGKYEQIDALYEGLASIHTELDPVNLIYYPFLYEPVIEFALSFPTYELFNKGYDRYPLRQSVSNRFKTETLWRRDKSETTGIFQLGVKKNLDSVLGLCLEGQLVKQGFVDREGLYKTILLISNGDVGHMQSFMKIASIEIFLKYWEEK